jgi:enamine deaminase RidA (YjgF/YER057c/UK114 family)
MSKAGAKLKELGLILPEPLRLPPGVILPFPWVHVRGDRAFVSGHGPQEADGALAGPFGTVGDRISVEQGRDIARKVALSMLGSLQRELGDLDRITGWCRVFGMVNCAPGFDRPPAVINGFSEVILEVFGPDIGRHARSAIGVAGLPFNIAVEVEAEITIAV